MGETTALVTSMPALFLSAGLAGCTAEVATFPVDLAKVRLQVQGEKHIVVGQLDTGTALKPRYRGMIDVWRIVAREEGVRALYSGITPALQRQLVFCSVRVGLYDTVKNKLITTLYGHDKQNEAGGNVLLRILAGVITGTCAITLGQPTDVVKIRMQVQSGGAAGAALTSGTFHAYKSIALTEGVRGLWRGIFPNCVRNSIVNATELVAYDMVKEMILHNGLMSDQMPCHFVSGMASGLITTIVASPVDVVKTRYMNATPGIYKNPMDCVIRTAKEGGALAFYKGFIPSFIREVCWATVMFVSFEQFKHYMALAENRVS